MARILEGTWEEIKAHDAELTGLKMRVIVEQVDYVDYAAEMPPPPTTVRDKAHLEELLLKGLNGGPGIEVTDEYWESKKKHLIDKLRSQAAAK